MGVGPQGRGLAVETSEASAGAAAGPPAEGSPPSPRAPAGDARGADRADVDAFLARREEAAFLRLYDRHTPALYQFTLRLLGGSTRDAEDAVQEAWLRAVDRLPGFRWGSSLRTWLHGFALNCAREILRRRARAERPRCGRAAGAAFVPGAEHPAPAPGMPLDDRVAGTLDIERALERLPDDMRVVLILHDVYGHTHEEVGALLGVSPGTSKSRTSRARRRMRALLRTGRDASIEAVSQPPGDIEERP